MQTTLNRTPYQGVCNIIRFNWHMYALSLLVLLLVFSASFFVPSAYSFYAYIACCALFLPTAISLIISFYIYDASKLYEFSWLIKGGSDILHLSAGFDETSEIIKNLYPHKTFHTMDFYHSLEKREISIQRAQKLYPLGETTLDIDLKHIPLPDSSVDKTFLLFSAHEIRNDAVRVSFFQEIHRITREQGELYVMEHQRDLPNFLAYTLGYLHFLTKASWRNTFQESGWKITKTIPHTPFVSIFILKKSHELTS